MTALQTFEKTMNRAYRQLTLCQMLSDSIEKGTIPNISDEEIAEIIRFSLVLGVSAFDAYFTDKFVECFLTYSKQFGFSEEGYKFMQKAGLDLKAALELLDMRRPNRRIRTIIDAYLEKYTTQKKEPIDELFLLYGLKNLCANAEKKSKKRNLVKRIEIAIQRRHLIVHAGDLDKFDRPKTITKKQVESWLNDISIFVQNSDQIIQNKISRNTATPKRDPQKAK